MPPAATEFFLVTLPGFEDLAAREAAEWYPGLEIKSGHGGITIMAPIEIGLAMNLALKIPTRILLRAGTFRCRDFPKLYNKVLEFPWTDFTDLSCKIEVEVSSSRSRLKMKKRIGETVTKAWRALQKKAGITADAGKPLSLFVRIADDDCTLSLDTSGERLHKRGSRTHVGEAPLRETIAAALIQLTAKTTTDSKPVEIIDPMMGSGTFLLEALTRDELVSARDFAFKVFHHPPLAKPELQTPRPQIAKAIGFESDPKTVAAAKTNLKGHLQAVELHSQDFFSAKPLGAAKGCQRWILANPPYGERLEVKIPLPEFYRKLFHQVETIAQPDRACFILPAKAVKGRFELPRGWKVVEKRAFSNGGIPVFAFVFARIDG